ncbi:MAG TPA: hypothetical protein VJW76_11845 [Verrucomicrobiae bacterium]|nr:hypothetical protein [Verrucomicrobiae bacterium]
MTDFPWLTALTFTPLVGGLLLLGLDQKSLARWLALGFNLLTLAMAVVIWLNFDTRETELQFARSYPWIPTLGIDYFVGIDGLGLLMILLSAIVVPMVVLASGGRAGTPLPAAASRGDDGAHPAAAGRPTS